MNNIHAYEIISTEGDDLFADIAEAEVTTLCERFRLRDNGEALWARTVVSTALRIGFRAASKWKDGGIA